MATPNHTDGRQGLHHFCPRLRALHGMRLSVYLDGRAKLSPACYKRAIYIVLMDFGAPTRYGMTALRDRSLITGRGGSTKREGGHVKFYPYEKGGGAQQALAMLFKGGHSKFWVSF